MDKITTDDSELLALKNEITYLKGENEMLRRDNAGLAWENGMLKEKLSQQPHPLA